MKVLITGGGGFLGTALSQTGVRHLVSRRTLRTFRNQAMIEWRIYHESGARHAMQTNEQALLTVWLWTSHLESEVVIVRG